MFSISLFAIRVNLRHPYPSVFLIVYYYLWCFSVFVKNYLQVGDFVDGRLSSGAGQKTPEIFVYASSNEK